MRTLSIALLATTMLAMPSLAFAQDAPSSDKDTAITEPEDGLGEIIVTAQKRAEGLSDVPISIAAVSGKQLEAYGSTSLEQASAAIPNLKITQTGIGNRIAIRGIASGDNKGFEQSVAMFVDGIYYGRDQLSLMPLVDLERIEVLRGPQPTLFGKNAIAGAVNVVSRRPTRELEASFSGLYEFRQDEMILNGVVSGPIGKNFAARAVGWYRDMKGYFYNTTLGRREPNLRQYFTRGMIDYDGGGAFTADLKLEYANFRALGKARETFNPVGSYTTVFRGPLAVDTVLDYKRQDNGTTSRNRVFNTVFNANLDVGASKLTAVTGYLNYKTREVFDVDYSGISFLDGTNQLEKYRQISQEIRLTSPDDKRFSYIVGAYFQHSKLNANDQVKFNPFFLGLTTSPTRFIGDSTNDRIFSQSSTLWSAFAQGQFKLTDALRITAGARFNHESKSGNRSLAINAGPRNIGATTPFPGFPNAMLAVFAGLNIVPHSVSGKFSENSVNPMVNVQYDLTDDLMAYVSYARGTKAGGFDIRSNSLPTSVVAKPGVFKFGPEKADTVEAGFKYKARNIAFNIAAYHTKYRDMQLSIFDGTLNFNVRNAARATTQGIEADARIRLDRYFTLSGAVAYLDFNFDSFPNGQCYFGQTPNAAGFCDYKGKRNLITPKWSGMLNGDFSHPIGSGLKLGVNLNADFSSAYLASSNLDPRTREDGYVRMGARLSIGAENNRWSLALVGRNLTSERVLLQASAMPLATTITSNTGNAYSGIFDRPRSIALQLDASF